MMLALIIAWDLYQYTLPLWTRSGTKTELLSILEVQGHVPEILLFLPEKYIVISS